LVTIRCRDRMFPHIQAVIFDKDGTLANAETFLRNLGLRRSRLIDAQVPGVQEPLRMAFGLDGAQINPAGLMAVGTRRENQIAAAAYVAETGRGWLEALQIVQSAFAEADQLLPRKADETPLFPGGLTIIQALAAAGLKLGILSADSTANVKDFALRYSLTPYLHLQMGTDGDRSKPDPVLLAQACAALDVPAAATLMVGDSPVDVQLARAGGAAGCIGVTWGWTEPLALAAADAVITQFDQIQVG